MPSSAVIDPASQRRHVRRFAADIIASGDADRRPAALFAVARTLLARALHGGLSTDAEAMARDAAPLAAAAWDRTTGDVRDALVAAAQTLGEAAGAPDTPAWLFQYLKADREQAAIGGSLADGTKIAGRRLLAATQFFTDAYMVEHLVRETLGDLAPARGLVVADPACGGGNFLVAALDHFVRAGHDDVDRLLGEVLVGYDLDPDAAAVARLALVVHATRLTGRLPTRMPRVHAGAVGDERGFLDPERSPYVHADLAAADRRVLLTNPPFLGRRLMSRPLKAWLAAHVPEAGNDLCLAFLLHCVDVLGPDDRVGLVHQSNWFHLATFEAARRRILGHTSILRSDDLGPGAFADLTGEKSRVALTVLAAPPGRPARFHRLVHRTRAENIAALAAPDPADTFVVDPARLLQRPGAALAYHVPPALDARARAMPTYGDFAEPMQGTSTGDNPRFVRFGWQVPSDDPDWRPVSKGGGYCKWAGLHRYRVLWADGGAAVRDHPGSAVRNLDRMDETALVYSDTGTAGMNVRVRRPTELFIASGPGIVVRRGRASAHLGYLNTRVATYFMRTLSPKLTISAGYISALPFCEELAADASLAEWADACVALKRKAGRSDPAGDLWVPPVALDEPVLPHALASIRARLDDELERLRLEARIEARVADVFGLDDAGRASIEAEVGAPVARSRGVEGPPGGSVLAAAARWGRGGKRSGPTRGVPPAEGLLEWVALETDGDVDAIREELEAVLPDCAPLRSREIDDVLHQHALVALGVGAGWARRERRVPVQELAARLRGALPGLDDALGDLTASRWLVSRLPAVHRAAFLNRPFLTVADDEVRVEAPR